jgi:hypothetical protein
MGLQAHRLLYIPLMLRDNVGRRTNWEVAMKLVAGAFALLLAACATPTTVLQNDLGQTATCSTAGFGILGTATALVAHGNCVESYRAAGFHEIGAPPVPQNAFSPPQQGWVARAPQPRPAYNVPAPPVPVPPEPEYSGTGTAPPDYEDQR